MSLEITAKTTRDRSVQISLEIMVLTSVQTHNARITSRVYISFVVGSGNVDGNASRNQGGDRDGNEGVATRGSATASPPMSPEKKANNPHCSKGPNVLAIADKSIAGVGCFNDIC